MCSAPATRPRHDSLRAWSALPKLASVTSRKTVHALCLVCGGVGLLSTYAVQDPKVLLLTMVGVGIAWASILSMPYAILSGALPPERMGVYMGIFNFFIVIPEIIASLSFQPLVRHAFHNNPLYVVMLGGAFLLIAAVFMIPVLDVTAVRQEAARPTGRPQTVPAESPVVAVPGHGAS